MEVDGEGFTVRLNLTVIEPKLFVGVITKSNINKVIKRLKALELLR